MARFKIGDDIRQLRFGQLYRKGTVLKGPFRIEGVDHYQVDWTWEAEPTNGRLQMRPDIVCDLISKKYSFM